MEPKRENRLLTIAQLCASVCAVLSVVNEEFAMFAIAMWGNVCLAYVRRERE